MSDQDLKEITAQVATLSRRMRLPPTAIFAHYNTAAEQSFTSGVGAICDYGTKVIDTHNCVTVGATWKFTCRETGVYSGKFFNIFAGSTGWAAGEVAYASLYKNGVNDRLVGYWIGFTNAVPTELFAHLSGFFDIYLVPGDYISVVIWQISGGAIKLTNTGLYNWITIRKDRSV